MATTFENKVAILADLSLYYKDSARFEEFIKTNDVSLPLAFLLKHGIVVKTEKAIPLINETFQWLLEGLGVEDSGFESLSSLLE